MTGKHIVYHIPVCPFSQRLEILLALRVNITKPRDPALLAKTQGTTALPVLETPNGAVLKESLVILRYLDEVIEGSALRRANPLEHAVETMLIAREGPFTMAGYLFVMNQEPDQRDAHAEKLLTIYRDIDSFEGRTVSSFAFLPHWRDRPWPPRDKYSGSASDERLGLV